METLPTIVLFIITFDAIPGQKFVEQPLNIVELRNENVHLLTLILEILYQKISLVLIDD